MYKNTWSDYSSYFSTKHLITGFTNKYFPYLSDCDRVEFAKLLKLDAGNIIKPKQIHSNNVTNCNKAGDIIDTDGIVTSKNDLVLSIQVADCIPIFLNDKKKQNIGLVHAGWRGVNFGIIENGIKRMMELDSNLLDIKVLLGPSIRQCCFEIGPEVGKLFNNKFQKIGKGDRKQLDLQGVIIDKLINMKIRFKNIIDVKECTYCSNKYHSFRRDSNKAGRMIAMMGWIQKSRIRS